MFKIPGEFVAEPDGWQICRVPPNLTSYLKIIEFFLFKACKGKQAVYGENGTDTC